MKNMAYAKEIFRLTKHLTLKKQRVALTVLTAIKESDPDQLYFWTPRWQKMEREADEDIKKGRVKKFDNVEELIADLKR